MLAVNAAESTNRFFSLFSTPTSGMTTFLSRKLIGRMYGEDARHLEYLSGKQPAPFFGGSSFLWEAEGILVVLFSAANTVPIFLCRLQGLLRVVGREGQIQPHYNNVSLTALSFSRRHPNTPDCNLPCAFLQVPEPGWWRFGRGSRSGCR